MKRQNRITLLGILMAFVVFLSSCGENTLDVLPTNPDEDISGETTESQESIVSQSVLDFIALKADLSKLQNIGGNSFGTNGAGGRAAARKAARQDSTDWDDEWYSCADVTEFEENGVYTITYDYGDGCEEGDDYFSVFNYGKYISVFKFDFSFDTLDWNGGVTGGYEGSMNYENFGSRYDFDGYENEFVLDGTAFYATTFKDIFDFNEYSSTMASSYQENLIIQEMTDGESFTAIIKSDVEEVYESAYNEGEDEFRDLLTITKANYTYTTNEAVYTSTVIEPLVMDFNCFEYEEDWEDWDDDEEGDDEGDEGEDGDDEGDWDDDEDREGDDGFTYVSGIEEVTVDGLKYTIDYGNGACDNIVIVTDEAGVSVEYDLATGEVAI
jgi:hypothetical protein